MSAAIECQHVSLERHRHNKQPFCVLNDITVAFNNSSMNLISGPTGAGKTSLLHILAGLLRPSSGQVLVDGQPVSRWTGVHRSRWRRRAGIAFQQHHLFEDMTALENVLVPLVPLCRSIRELRRLGRQALAELDMAGLAGEKIQVLSGGERQRINLARALVNRPEYIFVDEPTAHQDNASAAMIIRRLAQAQKNATAVIIVAHDPRIEASDAIDAHFRLVDGSLLPVG
jgi:ABC-type lipoprotein export system ATPase subunit